MNISKSIINKVSYFIKENELLNSKDNCLIAVSGGFDSTVLIDIIYKVKNLFKLENVSIAHINYNLRGQDSINDMNFVQSLSEKYEFKIFIKDINLNSYIRDYKIKDSMENIAREIRYSFFKEVALKNKFNKIVLAHNANDHAETILLKLIRGTVSGLKGIETKRLLNDNSNVELIRPILCLSREEIENYADENNLNPKTDITNAGNEYTRNRIRNKILPDIIRENPSFLDSIYNSSSIFNKEDKFLDNLSIEVLDKVLIEKCDNYIILSYSKLVTYDEILIYRVIKNCFKQLRNDSKSFSSKHIKAVYNNIKENISNKAIELPDNYSFLKDRDYLIFSKGKINLNTQNFNYSLKDNAYIKELDKNIILKKHGDIIKPDKNNLLFSVDKLDSIKIKNYDEKQMFIGFGKNTHISLKEFMDKNKVPQFIRKGLILIYINDIFLGVPEYLRSNQLIFQEGKKSYYFETR